MESLRKQMVSAGLMFLVLGFGLLALQPTVSNGQATAPAENLVRFNSPSMGPANAKVHIVEFLDPACETCAAF